MHAVAAADAEFDTNISCSRGIFTSIVNYASEEFNLAYGCAVYDKNSAQLHGNWLNIYVALFYYFYG